MSRRLLIAVVVLSLIAGALIGYVRGLPHDFVSSSATEDYRCGDGSEFSVALQPDGNAIRVIPATSVDYVRETVLQRSGQAFTDGTTTIAERATGIELQSGTHASTTCTVIRSTATEAYPGD